MMMPTQRPLLSLQTRLHWQLTLKDCVLQRKPIRLFLTLLIEHARSIQAQPRLLDPHTLKVVFPAHSRFRLHILRITAVEMVVVMTARMLAFQVFVSTSVLDPTEELMQALLAAIDQDSRLGSKRDVEPRQSGGDSTGRRMLEKRDSQARDLRALRLEVADELESFHFIPLRLAWYLIFFLAGSC